MTNGEHDAKMASALLMYSLTFCMLEAYEATLQPAVPILANTNPGAFLLFDANSPLRIFSERRSARRAPRCVRPVSRRDILGDPFGNPSLDEKVEAPRSCFEWRVY